MAGVILGADESPVFSREKVVAMLEQQFQQITQDQFVNLYFALIQLGFSERVKAHKSWSEDTATGLAEQAHQTVSAAFARLGKGQRERQAALAKMMADAEKGDTAKQAADAATTDVGQEHPTAAEEPAGGPA